MGILVLNLAKGCANVSWYPDESKVIESSLSNQDTGEPQNLSSFGVRSSPLGYLKTIEGFGWDKITEFHSLPWAGSPST